jgi:hypothetical protein
MKLIESKTLASAAASIEFTSIPQDSTDLVVLFSGRATLDVSMGQLSFNTGGTYTRRYLLGNGSSASSGTLGYDFAIVASARTANTFSNTAIYIPNYSGATAKSYSSDSVGESNETLSFATLVAGLWSGTAAITSINLYPEAGGNWAIGTTASLYKITKGSDGIVTTS